MSDPIELVAVGVNLTDRAWKRELALVILRHLRRVRRTAIRRTPGRWPTW